MPVSTRDRIERLLRLYHHRLRLVFNPDARRAPRVVANSVPKAGSHLLARCLTLMGIVNSRQHVHYLHPREKIERAFAHLKPGEYLTAHLPYLPFVEELMRARGARMVVIIRDPRDVVVSHFHYVTYKDRHHRLRDYYRRLPDDHARLMTSIRGIDPPAGQEHLRLPDVNERFRGVLAWQEHGAHVVRFEDLVGPKGGGDAHKQWDAIRGIGEYLGLPMPSTRVEEVAARLFHTKSATFRKGTIGDWRNHFTEEHKRVFKEIAGDLLVELGYERDTNW